MRKSGHLLKWLYYWTITLSLSTLVMNRCAESHFFDIVLTHAACRCGALPGRRKARTRASSRILTARPGSESSAPYPTHATSQGTSAARQAPPWTQRTSATCGDASFLRHRLWREGDGRKTGQDPDQRRHGQEMTTWSADNSCCLATSHLMPCRVLTEEGRNLHCLSSPIVSYWTASRSFWSLRLLQMHFWTLENNFQFFFSMWGTTLAFYISLHYSFVTWRD